MITYFNTVVKVKYQKGRKLYLFQKFGIQNKEKLHVYIDKIYKIGWVVYNTSLMQELEKKLETQEEMLYKMDNMGKYFRVNVKKETNVI